LEELGRGHAKGRIGSETALDQLVRNALGLELASIQAARPIARTRSTSPGRGTVGETVEDVEDLPVGIEGGEGQREPAADDQPDGRVGDDRPGAPLVSDAASGQQEPDRNDWQADSPAPHVPCPPERR